MEYDVVMAAHNEEGTVGMAILSLLRQSPRPRRIIVVLDRCSDRTPQIVSRFPVETVRKDVATWPSSYTENIQLGLERTQAPWVAIVDADVVVEREYFAKLAQKAGGDVGVISGTLVETPSGFWGRAAAAWQALWARLSPFSQPPGAALLFRRSLVTGFPRRVLSPDTYILTKAVEKGLRVVVRKDAYAHHLRETGLAKILGNQVYFGVSRALMGDGLARTLAHSAVRLRPMVLAGYLRARLSGVS